MVGGGRRADTDTAAQHNRHLEPAVAHVLNLGGLIDDLAQRIQGKVEEHVVDDRSGTHHGGTGTQASKAALDDRRIADALWPEALEQAERCREVAAAGAFGKGQLTHRRGPELWQGPDRDWPWPTRPPLPLASAPRAQCHPASVRR